jgi:hypothetical protein
MDAQPKKQLIFPEAVNEYFFKKAWEIFWDNRDYIFKLVIFTGIILSPIVYLLEMSLLSSISFQIPEDPDLLMQFLMKNVYIGLFINIILTIPKTFFLVAFIFVLPSMYEAVEINFMDSLSVKFDKWFMLFIYSVFVLIIEYIGFCMCIVPGILVLIQFAFLPFVIVLEEKVNVIQRSLKVVSGRQWNVFIIYLLYFAATLIPIIILSVFSFMASSGIDISAEDIGQTISSLSLFGFLETVVEQVITAFIMYFVVVLFFQLYMMSRIEKGEIEAVESD